MKVDPNLQSVANVASDAVQNAKTSRAQETPSESGTTKTDGSDTVQFSNTFAEVQQLTSAVQQVPDIRAERVAALRDKIQQGTYNPSSSDIANAILNDPMAHNGNG